MPADHLSDQVASQPETGPSLIPAVGEEDPDLGWRREHERLATIEEYWCARGYRIAARVERIATIHGAVVWGIKSNLRNGLPTTAISLTPSVKERLEMIAPPA